MNIQLNHKEFKKSQKTKKHNIALILENFQQPENIGSAFRIADSFNIEKIFIISDSSLDLKKINKISRSCLSHIDYEITTESTEVVNRLKSEGYNIFALEITNSSLPLRKYDFSHFKKIAIIVGNERNGIKSETLNLVDDSCHIDMYGNNSSMNVSSALAIAIYKITEDLLKNNETNSNLKNNI